MLRAMFKVGRFIVIHALIAYVGIAICLRIWPDMREKPPLEIFIVGFMGAVLSRYFFHVFGLDRMFGYLRHYTPPKTDPVIGPSPAKVHTYEEWKSDLDKVDGQGDLEEFLAKWSDVPPSMRPKKADFVQRAGPKGPDADSNLKGPPGPGDGYEIPNRPGIPPDVMGWIDKHYERASQLWQRAHPGQDLPNSRR